MYELLHQEANSRARTGIIHTAHGDVLTPAFVAVATRASVKAVEPAAIEEIGVQIVISNSYHLHLRPGEETIAGLGGLHGFSGWN
ncbi:tRNA-guanine transglycosylase, partial [Candidatus Bipolaricaulota bacterium]|nr:tRNA-guanine transglycosylase [Candidatus Bipolaricaulota bacterium]